MDTLYETDFYTWVNRQAQHLRAGAYDRIDVHNLIEELESMGVREKKELRNRLRVLLMHLLKWTYQPERRTRSWELTIGHQRDEIAVHLEDNPGLKPLIPETLATAYRLARSEAARETGKPQSQFPMDV